MPALLRYGTVFAAGALSGAALMTLLDPRSGRERRVRTREKLAHRSRQVQHTVQQRARYERGHVKDVIHDAAVRTHLSEEPPLPDEEGTLVDKVRSTAFRHSPQELSHINLTAAEGVIHVFGSAQSEAEATDIIQRIRAVHEVKDVISHLLIQPEGEPSAS